MTQLIKGYYFKALHEEGNNYISGLPLPDPAKGPYHFEDCNFHPRVWSALQQQYRKSTFEGCNHAPENEEAK